MKEDEISKPQQQSCVPRTATYRKFARRNWQAGTVVSTPSNSAGAEESPRSGTSRRRYHPRSRKPFMASGSFSSSILASFPPSTVNWIRPRRRNDSSPPAERSVVEWRSAHDLTVGSAPVPLKASERKYMMERIDRELRIESRANALDDVVNRRLWSPLSHSSLRGGAQPGADRQSTKMQEGTYLEIVVNYCIVSSAKLALS
jgi:hypothetical protein